MTARCPSRLTRSHRSASLATSLTLALAGTVLVLASPPPRPAPRRQPAPDDGPPKPPTACRPFTPRARPPGRHPRQPPRPPRTKGTITGRLLAQGTDPAMHSSPVSVLRPRPACRPERGKAGHRAHQRQRRVDPEAAPRALPGPGLPESGSPAEAGESLERERHGEVRRGRSSGSPPRTSDRTAPSTAGCATPGCLVPSCRTVAQPDHRGAAGRGHRHLQGRRGRILYLTRTDGASPRRRSRTARATTAPRSPPGPTASRPTATRAAHRLDGPGYRSKRLLVRAGRRSVTRSAPACRHRPRPGQQQCHPAPDQSSRSSTRTATLRQAWDQRDLPLRRRSLEPGPAPSPRLRRLGLRPQVADRRGLKSTSPPPTWRSTGRR